MGMEKTKLFCIPYAGGSATIYSKWKKYLDNDIELYPVELAGRGKRCGIPYYASFYEAVDDLFDCIKNYVSGRYALFGHSMGSWLALELAYKLIEHGYDSPTHIFFSGNRAPHIYREEKILHKLPDDEFNKEIFKIGGTSNELLENKELLAFFMPIIRSDYKLIENYDYKDHGTYLNCDISVLNGIDDDLKDAQIKGWEKYTKFKCNYYYMKGGHFFINEVVGDVIKVINKTLVQ